MSARPVTTSTNPVPRNAIAPSGAARFTFGFIGFRGYAALQCGKAPPYRNIPILNWRLCLHAYRRGAASTGGLQEDRSGKAEPYHTGRRQSRKHVDSLIEHPILKIKIKSFAMQSGKTKKREPSGPVLAE